MRIVKGGRSSPSANQSAVFGLAASVAIVMLSCSNEGAARGQKPPPSAETERGLHWSAATAAPVQVRVGKELVAGGVRYMYFVDNGSALPITTLTVGINEAQGLPELVRGPLNWAGDDVPTGSFTAPSGWICDVIPQEEENHVYVQWMVDTTLVTQPEMLGGQSLGGFAVVVAQADAAYEHGHWAVYVDSWESPGFDGLLIPDGTISVPLPIPTERLGVRVAPNPARQQLEIELEAAKAGPVTITVFDARGRRVVELPQRIVASGVSRIAWDGRREDGAQAPAGTYFLRVRFRGAEQYAKFVWMR